MGLKRVLVVDDDPDIREIIIYILESEGYCVSGLDSGRDVLSTVKNTLPDVVLLDVQLGDSDGRDLCRELKHQSDTKDIPIIMVSASHSWAACSEKQCHPEDFLAKPFDVKELIDHVRRFAA